MKTLIFGSLVAVLLYLLFWPVPVTPMAWEAPQDKGFTGQFAANQQLSELELIKIDNDLGPEDLAIDSRGNIVASLHSGSIAKLDKEKKQLVDWVNTGGRPLGIEFDAQDNLIVADAFKGLLSISPAGQVTLLTQQADAFNIDYADDLDIAEDGKIYFSDASTKFGAQRFGGTLEASLLDILEHGGHGRLLVYDPATKQTQTLADGINFANGIALSADQQSVFINETGSYRVLRYWLNGSKKGELDTVIDNLPGFPDNIARSPSGGLWLGLASPRSKALDAMSELPIIRTIVQRLPAFIRPKAQHYGHVIKISESGDVLDSLQDPSGEYPLTTGVLETEYFLYISSLTAGSLARMPIKQSK